MSEWYAPNQQAVRGDESGPAESGDGGSIVVAYDPGDHTVDEVKDYLTANPEEWDAVSSAERDGKARVSLISWLDGTHSEEPTGD